MRFRPAYYIAFLLIFAAPQLSIAVQIDTIIIAGNFKTKPQVILQQLEFKQGIQFDFKEVEHRKRISRENLINLNLFNQIILSLKEIKNSKGHYVLGVEVTEKWYLWPVPFVEFADRSIYQWSEFQFDPSRTNFGINIHKYNLFGLNQTLKVGLSMGYTDEVDFSYRSPRFGLEQQHRISMGAYWNRADEIWINTQNNKLQFYSNYGDEVIERKGLGFGWEWFRNNRNRMSAGVVQRSYEILDPQALEKNTSYLGVLSGSSETEALSQISRTTIYSTWVMDHRDNRFFAVRGHYISFGAAVSTYRDPGGGDIGGGLSFGFGGKVSKFMQLKNRLFGYFSFQAEKVYWDWQAPYNFSRALGYGEYVRGYEPFVVDATGFALVKAGLKYELVNGDFDLGVSSLNAYRVCPVAIYIGTYVDQAWTEPVSRFSNYASNTGNTLPGQHLAGAGIGIEGVFYYDKVFRFEYSLSRHFQPVWGVYFKQAI